MNALWSFARVLPLAVAFALPASSHAFEVMERNGNPAHWAAGAMPVPYMVGAAGSDDIPGDAELTAVQASFQRWNTVPCATIELSFAGTSPAPVKDINDATNHVFWVESGWPPELGPESIAVTTPALDAAGIIRDADLRFNGENWCWSVSGDTACMDVGHVATHEAGHFIGLDHDTGVAGAVMYPQSDPGKTDAALHQDDIDGVCFLYPAADGSAGAPCDGTASCSGGNVCAPHGTRPVCSTPCTQTSDCPSAFACVQGACVPGPGVGNATGEGVEAKEGARGSLCGPAAKCGAGLTCVLDELGSRCHTLCDSDAACAPGEACYDLEDAGGNPLGSAACFCESQACADEFVAAGEAPAEGTEGEPATEGKEGIEGAPPADGTEGGHTPEGGEGSASGEGSSGAGEGSEGDPPLGDDGAPATDTGDLGAGDDGPGDNASGNSADGADGGAPNEPGAAGPGSDPAAGSGCGCAHTQNQNPAPRNLSGIAAAVLVWFRRRRRDYMASYWEIGASVRFPPLDSGARARI